MTLWLPWADTTSHRAPARYQTGSYAAGYEPKLCVHATQVAPFTPRDDYNGKDSWPHWTLPRDGRLWQHLDADVPARALKNAPGGIETNRGHVYQVEVVGYSEDGDDLCTVPQLATLRHLVADLHRLRGVALIALAPGPIPGSARVDAPQRMSATEWRRFTGICGHRHVPENTHWDPGAFDLRRLLPAAEAPKPLEEDDDMGHVVEEKETGRVVIVAGNTRTHAATLAHVDELVAAKVVAPYTLPLPKVSVAALNDLFPEIAAA